MSRLKRVVAAIGAYAAHPDPRAAIANTVALVIVSNQPFYPLYLHWAVAPVVAPSYVTFLSTPLFAAVPAAMWRSTRFGRSLLLVAASATPCSVVSPSVLAQGSSPFCSPA